ncbi:hypothetical protein ABZY90_05295 [Streptomyces sp. NPDC006422]|uniref:hypothetical protein n=1 Tax=unclassified Streptomyces TaxID=2593676 RepID=UPI0033B999E1
MPEPKPTNRRAWIAVWAVMCVAGLAATSALNTSSSTPEPSRDERLGSDGCDRRIADLDQWVAERKQEREEEGKGSGIVALSAVHVDDDDVCHDAITEHFDTKR